MTENNAAQAAEQAIKAAIRKAYDDGYNDAKMAPENCSTYCVERAVRLDSAALLSKLRAEGVQAGDERAAFNERYEAICNRSITIREIAWRMWKARAALASAPVAADPVVMKEICPACSHQFECFHNPYINELRASAPVAGEALGFVAAAALETNFNDPDARIDMFKTDLGLLGYYHAATPVAVYVAPQASEAVCPCPSGDGSLRHPCAVHPDCAKGARDERAAFEAAVHDEYGVSAPSMLLRDADGEYATMNTEWAFWLKRAALSAQPGAQNDA